MLRGISGREDRGSREMTQSWRLFGEIGKDLHDNEYMDWISAEYKDFMKKHKKIISWSVHFYDSMLCLDYVEGQDMAPVKPSRVDYKK